AALRGRRTRDGRRQAAADARGSGGARRGPGAHQGSRGSHPGGEGGRRGGAAAGPLPVRLLVVRPAARRRGHGADHRRHHPPDRVLGAALGGRRPGRRDDQDALRHPRHPHPDGAADVHDEADGPCQGRASARRGGPSPCRRCRL
ncbi:MAG: hypothetical protein AVDCRST_MAG89-3252, partial [uncultured Gemmatimonadetes bacterium]